MNDSRIATANLSCRVPCTQTNASLNGIRVTILSLLAVAVALPALGTSYILASDEELADFSHVIAYGTVGEVYAPRVGHPYTDYAFEVERAIRGVPSGTTLMVSVLGGELPGGGLRHIWGTPKFRPGQRALLFLRQRDDGVLRITHMTQGAFREIEVDGRPLAMRNMASAAGVHRPSSSGKPEPVSIRRAHHPRDMGRFMSWLDDRLNGRVRKSDYFEDPVLTVGVKPAEAFNVITYDTSIGTLAGRWAEFDTATSVPWRYRGKQPGLAGGGSNELQSAIDKLNAYRSINFALAGKTKTKTSFFVYDQQNVVLFNDPNNEAADFDKSSCSGVLAFAGSGCDTCFTQPIGGDTFLQFTEGDMVVNKNIKCTFQGPNGSANAEEIFGHEFAHALGLGHTCEIAADGVSTPDCKKKKEVAALMYPFAKGDGRGAKLNGDDKKGFKKGLKY